MSMSRVNSNKSKRLQPNHKKPTTRKKTRRQPPSIIIEDKHLELILSQLHNKTILAKKAFNPDLHLDTLQKYFRWDLIDTPEKAANSAVTHYDLLLLIDCMNNESFSNLLKSSGEESRAAQKYFADLMNPKSVFQNLTEESKLDETQFILMTTMLFRQRDFISKPLTLPIHPYGGVTYIEKLFERISKIKFDEIPTDDGHSASSIFSLLLTCGYSEISKLFLETIKPTKNPNEYTYFDFLFENASLLNQKEILKSLLESSDSNVETRKQAILAVLIRRPQRIRLLKDLLTSCATNPKLLPLLDEINLIKPTSVEDLSFVSSGSETDLDSSLENHGSSGEESDSDYKSSTSVNKSVASPPQSSPSDITAISLDVDTESFLNTFDKMTPENQCNFLIKLIRNRDHNCTDYLLRKLPLSSDSVLSYCFKKLNSHANSKEIITSILATILRLKTGKSIRHNLINQYMNAFVEKDQCIKTLSEISLIQSYEPARRILIAEMKEIHLHKTQKEAVSTQGTTSMVMTSVSDVTPVITGTTPATTEEIISAATINLGIDNSDPIITEEEIPSASDTNLGVDNSAPITTGAEIPSATDANSEVGNSASVISKAETQSATDNNPEIGNPDLVLTEAETTNTTETNHEVDNSASVILDAETQSAANNNPLIDDTNSAASHTHKSNPQSQTDVCTHAPGSYPPGYPAPVSQPSGFPLHGYYQPPFIPLPGFGAQYIHPALGGFPVPYNFSAQSTQSNSSTSQIPSVSQALAEETQPEKNNPQQASVNELTKLIFKTLTEETEKYVEHMAKTITDAIAKTSAELQRRHEAIMRPTMDRLIQLRLLEQNLPMQNQREQATIKRISSTSSTGTESTFNNRAPASGMAPLTRRDHNGNPILRSYPQQSGTLYGRGNHQQSASSTTLIPRPPTNGNQD